MFIRSEIKPCFFSQKSGIDKISYFKLFDQSLDKTSFDFSNISSAMQSRAMSAKRGIMLKLPKSMVI